MTGLSMSHFLTNGILSGRSTRILPTLFGSVDGSILKMECCNNSEEVKCYGLRGRSWKEENECLIAGAVMPRTQFALLPFSFLQFFLKIFALLSPAKSYKGSQSTSSTKGVVNQHSFRGGNKSSGAL